eukprot:6193454-Pyramimonas_sp.AAC.1
MLSKSQAIGACDFMCMSGLVVKQAEARVRSAVAAGAWAWPGWSSSPRLVSPRFCRWASWVVGSSRRL